MRNGEGILDLPQLHTGTFLQREQAVLDRAVDGVEVDDDIIGGEGDVVQDGVDSRRGVLDEGEGGGGGVEEGGEEVERVLGLGWAEAADEEVGVGFGGGLVGAEGGLDGEGVGAEGSCVFYC